MDSIVVLGGGPAGFMAAVSAAETARGRISVRVVEKGRPLETLIPTGGGRCNLTNAEGNPRELASHYPRGDTFLLSAFTRFGAGETMEWFRSRGLELAEEPDGRVFPATRRSKDVCAFLLELAQRTGVEVTGHTPVLAARAIPGGFELETPTGKISCRRLVIATGGGRGPGAGGPSDSGGRAAASPAGATGHELARSLGHTVTRLAPSLTALVSSDPWPGSLAGLTLAGARLRAVHDGRKVADERGDLVFTHRGVSGPLAFRVSSRAAFVPFGPDSPLACTLSAAPELNEQEIEAALAERFASRPRAEAISELRRLIPRSLAEAVLRLSGLEPAVRCSQVSRGKRRVVSSLAAAMPLSIVSHEPGAEMVTAGGVTLDEMDQKTMGSRIVPGLFFCGEVLDIDGFTGGFNLQACWTTGRLAGLAAAGA
jgi:predicted Rossmann fold flavoprotein